MPKSVARKIMLEIPTQKYAKAWRPWATGNFLEVTKRCNICSRYVEKWYHFDIRISL